MGKSATFEGSTAVAETYQPPCHQVWRSAECDSPAAAAAAPAPPPLPLPSPPAVKEEWDAVGGLDAVQLKALRKVASQGVLWTHPSKPALTVLYTLHHGGDVEADGNCLFTAFQKAMQVQESPLEVRLRTVKRFQQDYDAATPAAARDLDSMISHLYAPDLSTGWGVHVVQELKLLACRADREALDTAIQELITVGVARDAAAESVYKERCLAVEAGSSWAKYMSITGSSSDVYDIISLLYTEEGILSVDENRQGRAAAFGDDLAIDCLASEYEREIFVVQAHGSDAIVEAANCLFFCRIALTAKLKSATRRHSSS